MIAAPGATAIRLATSGEVLSDSIFRTAVLEELQVIFWLGMTLFFASYAVAKTLERCPTFNETDGGAT